ncbi:MAG: hypothetical protein IKK57_03985 [Clostridia bacterium]|nr:hypothetical protein [Clostridia bacterium]
MSALRARYHRLQQDSRLEKELSFPVLLWLFVAGSLLGFVLEGTYHFLHHGCWGFRVGTLWGPSVCCTASARWRCTWWPCASGIKGR